MAAACVLIIDAKGKVLLQRRSDNGAWGIPGGAMEPGETFEETARREVFEETGLTVRSLTLVGTNSGPGAYYVYPNGDAVHLAGVIFASRDFSGQLHASDAETVDLRWFSPTALPNPLNPLDLAPLHHLREITWDPLDPGTSLPSADARPGLGSRP